MKMVIDIIEVTLAAITLFLLIFIYVVRLEIKVARMANDLCWIKKTLSRRSTDNRENGDADANDLG